MPIETYRGLSFDAQEFLDLLVISHLTLTYNRIRQASITKEIIEIVSGAAAAGH